MKTFLKDNADIIEQAIREVFLGSEDDQNQINGGVVAYAYNDVSCNDFSLLDQNWSKSTSNKVYGPGIQIIVDFPNIGEKKVFYPEVECETIEEFIDNLNTDFGMAQVMYGDFQNLNISWYDLTDNVIQTKSTYYTVYGFKDDVQTMKGFDKCWNPETLEFSDVAFYALQGNEKPRYKGENTSDEPQKMQGVDKAKFMAMVQEKVDQNDAADTTATFSPSMH